MLRYNFTDVTIVNIVIYNISFTNSAKTIKQTSSMLGFTCSNENKSCKTKLVPKFLKYLLESFQAPRSPVVRDFGETMNRGMNVLKLQPINVLE